MLFRSVSHKSPAIRLRGEAQLSDQSLKARAFVEGSKPAIHMDRRDFAGCSCRLKQLHDPVDGRLGQAGHVLTEINGQIQLPVGLVGGQGTTGHRPQDLLGEESFARSLTRTDLEWLLSPPTEPAES